MPVYAQVLDAVTRGGSAALVTLSRAEGSTPRDADAFMVVLPSGGFYGTIGGGALEWEVLRQARAALEGGSAGAQTFTHSLGPGLGQCCGGRVSGRIEVFDAGRRGELMALMEAEGGGEPLTPLLLFGAGHVGRALVLALAPLPFRTRWIDQRADAFPAAMPANATAAAPAPPLAEIAAAPAGAFVLVMTHSHALDLEIVSAALAARRFAYVGLIGSAAKRARFETRLRASGLAETDLARLVCPIGMAGVSGKHPAVIAAATAAQLLQARAAL